MTIPTEELTPDERRIRERIVAVLGEPPERYAAPEQMSPADHAQRQAGEQVESPEYVAYAETIKRAAGLDADEPALEAGPAAHALRKYGDANREGNR